MYGSYLICAQAFSQLIFQICPDPIRQTPLLNEYSSPWGSCPGSVYCLMGNRTASPPYSQLSTFIGEQPLLAMNSICDCEHYTYGLSMHGFGPFCTWRKPPGSDCENGEHDDHNFMTGCDCRHPNGTILPYHGWYCEVHNAFLCKDDKFYDLSQKIRKVGDTDPCKSCSRFMSGCEICIQNNETNCKLRKIRISLVNLSKGKLNAKNAILITSMS